ncbi:MAG: metallophosphoesterase family protein [Nocardioidaceae bacterium]
MTYTARWVPPDTLARWPAPSADATTIQLMGDTHFVGSLDGWGHWPLPGNDTTYDAIGRDVTDAVLGQIPKRIFQLGDQVDNRLPRTEARQLTQLQGYRDWMALYDMKLELVAGNHDTPRGLTTGSQWASYWGYEHPYRAVDLGDYRALILGGDDARFNHWQFDLPVLRYTDALVSWLDTELGTDKRPTVIMNHAPLPNSPLSNPNQPEASQTTQSGGDEATDLLEVMDSHPNVIGFLHAHTHNPFDGVGSDYDHSNVSRYNIGSRSIPQIDAGCVLERREPHFGKGRQNMLGPAVTFYVSILNDGRTLEVRWRKHDQRLWTSVPGVGRVQRLST